MTRCYAEVIGDPVAHSLSPVIHNFWLEKLGIDAEYRATHVAVGGLADFMADRRTDSAWHGCNVTMPHKIVMTAAVDVMDRSAELVGAINTVVPIASAVHGYNTDVGGIGELLDRLDRSIGGYPDHVATYSQIIGAGGAARAAMVAAFARGDVEFFNRDDAKARALAIECGLSEWFGRGLSALGPIRNPGDGPEDQRYSHIVINATSMGMEGQPAVPIDLSSYYPDTIVFDMVYAPVDTPLLAQARRLRLRTIDGLEMLVAQAAPAFELFFGAPAPREHDAELRALLMR